MEFSMTVPCSNCPFRREGGIPLRSSRVREIAGMMLHPSGGTFPCHKSVEYDDDGEPSDGEVHCAGALIFAEKNDNATQMMRIMERFGEYDHTAFTEEARASVFDTLGEMLKANRKTAVKHD